MHKKSHFCTKPPKFDITMLYPIAFLLAALLVSQTEGLGVRKAKEGMQSVAVKGRRTFKFLQDKKLDEIKTDASGSFYLSATRKEFINPTVQIYHKCGYSGPCYMKFGFNVKKKFISSGSKPQEAYDIGILDLQSTGHPITMQYPIAFLLAALLVSQTECLLGVGRLQSVAVKGVLECNGKPAKDVKVKLYEKGRFFDKKLDEKKTDAAGSFYLSGSKREITNIDPKVNIYHRCNYHGPCYKKFGITIPDNFISSGSKPQKLFDIGRLNLAGRMPGQTTDCLN
ncbi:unnamed protein product [Cylicocyclus nassatus]|uniref:Transthyretin-like family protein n=1 Tax=Cylicocyclus nassatus TaxID=53992 RepID=A0AA36H0N4_CYLNA|nr:unnamed protein product [Cylicocyclus nassatus]